MVPKKFLPPIACVLLLLMIPSLAAAASTGRVLTLSPDEGPPGTLVSITGTGFAANTLYRVYFDSDGDERWDSGETFRTVRTDTVGKFTTTLTIPSVPSGVYYIRADAPPFGPPADASAKFTVKTVYEKLMDIQDLIEEIEGKLDALPSWGDIVKKNLGDVVSAIWAADLDPTKHGNQTAYDLLSEIKSEIKVIEKRVLSLPTTWGDIVGKNWADLTNELDELESNIKDYIVEAKEQIEEFITQAKQKILEEIDEAQEKLSSIESKLGAFNNDDTVAELLYRILEEKSFKGSLSGTYSWDPAFNPTAGKFIAVNPVSGTGSGNINGESISFTIKGYLRSDWGHALAFPEKFGDDCALVDGRLTITVTGSGEIFVRVDGIQCEKGGGINELTGTFEIIAGTGKYAGAEGSGKIIVTINTTTRSFTGSFDGIIK